VRYVDGIEVRLGDIVTVPVPSGSAKGKIVMLGDSREHLPIEPSFLAWVQREPALLKPGSVVIEWVDENPLAHSDPRYAPAGDYMFTPIDQFVTKNV